MVKLWSCVLLSILILAFCLVVIKANDASLLTRKRRWLIFPKGSSLQLVYCFLLSTYGTKAGIFTIGITVGLAWEIPVDVRKYVFEHEEKKVHDRDRRELFGKIERFLDKQSGQGEMCVLKAICETRNRPEGKLTFMQAIVFEIFSLENEEFWTSHRKYKNAAITPEECATKYPCKFSFYHNNVP